MRSSPSLVASAVVGGLVLLCVAAPATAQQSHEIVRIASLMSGSIGGSVSDEAGSPVAGAMVSAVGATTAVAYSDRQGRFELKTLTPGPYLLRAQLAGFVTPRGQIVEVHPSSRSASSIELRRATGADASKATPAAAQPTAAPIVTASFAPLPENQPASDASPTSATSDQPAAGSDTTPTSDDHSEIAWRLRYARRGVLKDLALPSDVAGVSRQPRETDSIFGGRGDSALSASLFSSMPVSGQVNLLTASSFDTPEQLFSTDSFARSIAYMSLVAPAGEHADWSMRGALTQGDISSWFVAAAYTTRAPARHKYDLGFSYSTQRYDGGNPAALREVTDGNRNAGLVSAADTLTIAPNVSISYGATYARYGYLTGHGLLSPSVGVTFDAAEGLRVIARMSSAALAPGAEEFLPPAEGGIWLPPQRTFSTLNDEGALQPERTTSFSVEAEHDVDAKATSTVSLRVFRQNVADQMVTMFGVDTPDAPGSQLGHYFVGTVGSVDALGWSAAFRTTAFSRVRGSVEYRMTQSDWHHPADSAYMMLLAPLVVRPAAERVQDVSTSIETNVPETATRVLVVCRLSNLHATGGADRPMYDSRFDVQVRQSLPFMDFSNAKWEMLLAVRNFFREGSQDSSVYDELLVVRPPKRIVGGLTLRF